MVIILVIFIIFIIPIILIIPSINFFFLFWQVRSHLCIADHLWKEKREAIAQTVDALGDQFLLEIRAALLTYIRKTYPDEEADEVYAIGQGAWVLDD